MSKLNKADVTHLVVHCSATRATQHIGAKEIDRWHRERGFFQIGYHFVIRRDGTRETGRKLDTVGAHVSGHNTTSIGICMVGGVADDGRTPENNFTLNQFADLGQLLRDLQVMFPHAEIVGHRDLLQAGRGYKDCPSFDVRAWAKQTGVIA